MSGKGSAPRHKRDDDAYSKNWDLIFGKKEKQDELLSSNAVTGQGKGRKSISTPFNKRGIKINW